ncbi:LPS export ABC transporter periplasmic protein LptC [Melaminivora sp.]|uniref:LPS export ABC transporter periplasmic protein LptC n=1 Tax=Melaminivora sp. TaxID=1933032 RepID=UPI0028A8E76B|nr:LPS export ABC transporter periplasmic protein LptC [Melaminivora sp.]
MKGGRLRQGWERLTLYLPVLLMGLLALGTWWLVRNAPRPVQAAPEQPLRHEPDYYMRDFSVQTFDAAGRTTGELRGTLAQHYPDTDTLEVDEARMRSLAEDGSVTTASARRALSNADGSEVQLFGNARVVRETPARAGAPATPRLEFAGEFLHAWVHEERVRSDQPVQLRRGADTFTADRLEYDHLAQVLQLDGRVRGTLMPPAARR